MMRSSLDAQRAGDDEQRVYRAERLQYCLLCMHRSARLRACSTEAHVVAEIAEHARELVSLLLHTLCMTVTYIMLVALLMAKDALSCDDLQGHAMLADE